MKMIQLKILTGLFASLILLGASPIFAQHGQMNKSNQDSGFQCNIPDLSADQQKKIEDLSIGHQKKMLQLRNQIQEKEAALNTLRTADKAEMTAINKTIDEIGAIKTQIMKEREAHNQQVRSILTESQKVFFDTRGGKGFKNGQCCGNGGGPGWSKTTRYLI
jgi:Spy/CpxP family protein refolding chaperone